VRPATEIESFIADGFVVAQGAVPRETIRQCLKDLAPGFAETGLSPDDPTTWSKPVVRLMTPITRSFIDAGTRPLIYATYDRLVGEGKWNPPGRLGATVAVRFASSIDPGDAGWHIDGSFERSGQWHVNVFSAQRALLCLFLLSDVTPDDAPTELKIGSHADAARSLLSFGTNGVAFLARPSAFATGAAGDVFFCYPFIVHRATWPHRGTMPRYLAQPGLQHHGGSPTFAYEPSPYTLVGPGRVSPVEQAIQRAVDPSMSRARLATTDAISAHNSGVVGQAGAASAIR
jgi:hypothetical protein